MFNFLTKKCSQCLRARPRAMFNFGNQICNNCIDQANSPSLKEFLPEGFPNMSGAKIIDLHGHHDVDSCSSYNDSSSSSNSSSSTSFD